MNAQNHAERMQRAGQDTERAGWHYSGDISLPYGGTFVKNDPQAYEWGYGEVVEVTDLDSACGFTGAVLVERGSANGTDDKVRILSALRARGMTPRDLLSIRGAANKRTEIVRALWDYGYRDIERTEIWQLEEDGPLTFEGWTARRLAGGEIGGYVVRNFLDA